MRARRWSTLPLMILLLVWTPALSQVDDMTPYTYIVIELDVRKVTMDGIEARIGLMQSSAFTRRQDRILDEATRREIHEVYAAYGTTATKHTMYATRNARAISDWIEAHPEWQERYNDTNEQFNHLLATLEALQGGR